MIVQAPPMNTRMMVSNSAAATIDEPTNQVIPSHDLRKVGLQSATSRLSASVGDLDVVFEARARADVVFCPVCPDPHPVG